jgi:hypothetical protein
MKFQKLAKSEEEEIVIEFGNTGAPGELKKSLQLALAGDVDRESSTSDSDANALIENSSGETHGNEHEQLPSAVIVAFAVNYVMGTVIGIRI